MTKRLAVLLFASAHLACHSSPPVVTDGGAGGGSDCTDLKLSDLNCGRCGNACATGESCADGRCLPQVCGTRTCSGENVCLDSVCADRRCFGVSCPSGQGCAGGACYPLACPQGCQANQVCVGGACAEAACVGVLCPAGLPCVAGACRANTCADGVKSGTESDADCGGDVCPACPDARTCAVPLDCLSRVCTAQHCAAATCSDGVRNGDEGDIDCGGSCPACADGRTCMTPAQCQSGVCGAGHCAAASCTDGVQNGGETDRDCGASCPPCADGLKCTMASDCTSTRCITGQCVSASCNNNSKDGTETDVDCGGMCAGCAAGRTCAVGTDCASLVCPVASLRCVAPSCIDLVKNGNETDVDCGGTCTQTCAVGKKCAVRGDCGSYSCPNGVCLAPTCSDGAQNGGESDVDCGGDGGCARCGADAGCVHASDCASGACFGNLHCDAPTFFGQPVLMPTGAGSESVTIADVDNDGLLDLVVANTPAGSITVLFQQTDGGLQKVPDLQVTQGSQIHGPPSVGVGDITGDGVPDLVTARTQFNGCNNYSCRVTVLAGVGNRQFAAGVDSAAQVPSSGQWGSGCGGVTLLGRVNADSQLDLIIGDGAPADVWDTSCGGQPDISYDVFGSSIMLQGAASTFGQLQNLPTSGTWIATADFNGDGFLDVAGHSGNASLVSVYLGSANGTFQAPRTFGVAAGDGVLAAGQMTQGDTNVDLVFATRGVSAVAVARGLGTGSFLAPQSFPVQAPDGVALADIDGDGKLDVVVGAIGVAVLLGNGDGTLKPAVVSGASLGDVGQVAIGDLNGDGKPDVACVVSGTVRVLYNLRP